jgi:hypothetical protein
MGSIAAGSDEVAAEPVSCFSARSSDFFLKSRRKNGARRGFEVFSSEFSFGAGLPSGSSALLFGSEGVDSGSLMRLFFLF